MKRHILAAYMILSTLFLLMAFQHNASPQKESHDVAVQISHAHKVAVMEVDPGAWWRDPVAPAQEEVLIASH